MPPMRVLAPAKINLHLRVGPRREDGFHSLLSWFVTVGLFDTLTFETASAGSVTSLTCDMPGLPCDERNLVMRVASALSVDVNSATPQRIALSKQIPTGAGLGGGSADAARALVALNQIWHAGRSAGELSALAARFGSDPSFFFHAPSAICRGRGEIVEPIARPSASWVMLVLPRVEMPTPAVYRRFDAMGLGRERDIEDAPDWLAWLRLSSEELLPQLVNDLEPPAFDIAPDLGALRSGLERQLKRPVRMSGSGSSLFTLYDDEAAAKEFAQRVNREMSVNAMAVELGPKLADDIG
jgi:4-diphosphocytidyl-2-C-methyl-D-erythritol kinase